VTGVDEPEVELEQLRRAMETRPVIDQAHGVLMAAYGCTPEEAWQVLQGASQHTNTKLHVVAEQVAEATQAVPMADSVRAAVMAQLRALGKPPA
jgi:AmiR/NasT family two-component response regulator